VDTQLLLARLQLQHKMEQMEVAVLVVFLDQMVPQEHPVHQELRVHLGIPDQVEQVEL
jgi:hypothetical protein